MLHHNFRSRVSPRIAFVSEFAQVTSTVIALLGRNYTLMVIATIPVGLAVGGIEFLLSDALYRFLAKHQIVPDVPVASSWSLLEPLYDLLLFAALIPALKILGGVVAGRSAEGFSKRIRHLLVAAILDIGRDSKGLSVAQTSHISSTVMVRTSGFIQAFSSSLTSICSILVMFGLILHISPTLTLFTVGIAAIAAIPFRIVRRFEMPLHDQISKQTAAFTTSFMKDVRNAPFLKISGANSQEKTRLLEIAKRIYLYQNRWLMRFLTKTNLPQFMIILASAAVVLFNKEHLHIGISELAPFIYLLSRLAANAAGLVANFATMQYTYPYAAELTSKKHLLPLDVLQDTSHATATAPSRRMSINALEVRNLGVGRERLVAGDINFGIKRGDFLVISGASGVGKTTLLMSLVGLVPRLHGDILWNDLTLDEIDQSGLRTAIGYAGPDPYLLDGTIRENLEFGSLRKSIPDSELRNALVCCAAEFIFDLKGGLDHLLAESGEGLSAGQRQRISLARLLLRNPDVIFLDEATANIDETTEETIMNRIKKNYPNVIILAISHRRSMRAHATDFIDLRPHSENTASM